MRTLAFGDIHGCYDSLVALWDEVEPTSKDTIIFLGDYVDRGPHSKQVIDFLLEKMEGLSLIRLTGNHEEKFYYLVFMILKLKHGLKIGMPSPRSILTE